MHHYKVTIELPSGAVCSEFVDALNHDEVREVIRIQVGADVKVLKIEIWGW